MSGSSGTGENKEGIMESSPENDRDLNLGG